MVRQRLNSGVAGVAFAVVLMVAFAYLVPGFNMALWWWETSSLLWTSLGLAITGFLIGALARAGSEYLMLAVVPAVLLGLAHTLGWEPIVNGFDPASPVAVGALMAVSLWLYSKADDSTGHEPRSTRARSVLLLTGGALLALLFLGVLDRLERSLYGTLPELASARWQVFGLIILGGVFAGVFLVTWRTPLLNIGALAMLCFMFLAHPVILGGTSQWASGLLALTQDAQIAMMSPVIPLVVGVLTAILASQLTFQSKGSRIRGRARVGVSGY